MSRLKKSTWKWIIPFLIMIITLILFRMIFLLGYVPTESMEPTLKKRQLYCWSPDLFQT